MRRKIAPALAAVLAWPPPYAKTGLNAALVSVQAQREYRALITVARALQTHADKGNNWPACLRALARLSRRSPGQGAT